MKFKTVIFSVVVFTLNINFLLAQIDQGIKNKIALTPLMGWSSWNTLKKNPTDTAIKAMADVMAKSGLKKAGYTYINVDDFWCLGRDSMTGKMIIDSTKFPGGMKVLADYIHSKGLKAGIYTNIGTKANYATLASSNYFDRDIQTFADWGYDFVKIDANFAPERTGDYYNAEFTKAALAIQKTGRPIFLSICNQGGGKYQNWASQVGNSWRVGPDIDHVKGTTSQWEGVVYELDRSAAFPAIAGPGHWNDADMMLVGVGSDGGRLKVMNYDEQIAHFSMWCMIASPLVLGNDLRTMTDSVLNIVTNKEAIAINQDTLGSQGTLLEEVLPGLQVWSKKLSGKNKYAIALLNRSENEAEMKFDFRKIGLPGRQAIRDVWRHKYIGRFTGHKSKVPAHGCVLLVVN